MPYEWTLDGKKWKGVKYSTEEAYNARQEARKAFCKMLCNCYEQYANCLDFRMNDGETIDGVDYDVAIYDLLPYKDGSGKDNPQIGIITDGNGVCGWFSGEGTEKYKEGLRPERLFYCEPIDEAKEK